MDDQDQENFERVSLGIELKTALGERLAIEITERLQEQRMKALFALEAVSAGNVEEILRLQVEAGSARKALGVLEEILQQGEFAEQELREKDETENE